MRRVLVVGGWYPPCDRWPTAARRLSSLVRGLPMHGWAPTVLLPDLTNGLCGCGPCSAGAPPVTFDGVEVARVPVEPSSLRRLSGRVSGAGEGSGPSASLESPGNLSGLARTLARSLNSTQSSWGRAVRVEADARLAGGGFHAIFTTSGPFDHVRPIADLARNHRTPWVADLRDPATIDVTVVGTPIERLVRRGRRAVCRALDGADALVAATPQVVEVDRDRLGTVELLLPGFDAREWAGARRVATPPSDRVEVVYAGQLYAAYRRPDLFLRGLRQAAKQTGTDEIRLVYYGRDGEVLRAIAEREGSSHLVDDRGFVSPTDMPSRLASASALLLLTNEVGATGVPGGKFYEYLAAHRPLLAVPDADRFVAAVLDETRAGTGASDEDQVASQLVAWREQLRSSGSIAFDGRTDVIDRYSDAGTVERLAQLLDECREGAGRR